MFAEGQETLGRHELVEGIVPLPPDRRAHLFAPQVHEAVGLVNTKPSFTKEPTSSSFGDLELRRNLADCLTLHEVKP